MEIKHSNTSEHGKFFIEQDGQEVAKMTYAWAGTDRIIINHTEVGEVLKGTGAGKKMLSQAVDFARAQSIKIVPVCSFARSVFEKVPEFQDVL